MLRSIGIAVGRGHQAMPRSICLSVCLSVRLSVPGGLGVPQLLCRPPELCGLWIRPRTDVDPPRSAGTYRLAAR